MTTIMIAMGATVLILFMMAMMVAAFSPDLSISEFSDKALIIIIFSVVIAVAGIVAVWFFAYFIGKSI